MNSKPKTELSRCVFVQKRNNVNGALKVYKILTGRIITIVVVFINTQYQAICYCLENCHLSVSLVLR